MLHRTHPDSLHHETNVADTQEIGALVNCINRLNMA